MAEDETRRLVGGITIYDHDGQLRIEVDVQPDVTDAEREIVWGMAQLWHEMDFPHGLGKSTWVNGHPHSYVEERLLQVYTEKEIEIVRHLGLWDCVKLSDSPIGPLPEEVWDDAC